MGLIALGVAYLRESRLSRRLRESYFALTNANQALDAQRQKAEDREQLAIDAVKRFRDAVARNPELKDNPSLESLRKALLKEPLAFFSALRDRLQSDPSTRPESLARLSRAQLDLAFTIRDIGQIPDAIKVFNGSIQIWERLGRLHPQVAEYRIHLAANLHDLGILLESSGQSDEAERVFERAYHPGEATRERSGEPRPAGRSRRHTR